MSAPVILASASPSRAAMLKNAGIPFDTRPARVDEAAIKRSMQLAGHDVEGVAEALAATKAQQVSKGQPGALVIGADQMLACGDTWLDKPVDPDDARSQLEMLRGRTHQLISAVSVVQDGMVIWHHIDHARMTMRPFSDDFLERYIAGMGEDIRATVGGYQLEGLGVQLFGAIDGDFFTILGMPLLPLLDFLRGHGVIAE